MGHSKTHSKRKVYSNNILPQKTRKILINNLTLHLQQLEKEKQTKPQVSRRKEIIKNRVEIKEIEMKKTIEKSLKLEASSLKRNKVDKPMIRFINNRRDRAQINKIRNKKEEMDTTEIQRIIRDYYKQLYANKVDNLEKMDKFLDKYKLARLNQEETENTNRPITSIEMENMI